MDRTLALLPLVATLIAMPVLAQAPAAAPEATEAASRPSTPRPNSPRAFRSPEEGFAALIAALRANDDRALLRILGSAGDRLVRSGDRVIDRAARSRVIDEYAVKNEILRPAPNEAVLQLGADDWPMPLPMIERGGAWRFDAAAATQEIVDRRIGRNELDTIETLRAMADAQDDYARTAGRHGALRA